MRCKIYSTDGVRLEEGASIQLLGHERRPVLAVGGGMKKGKRAAWLDLRGVTDEDRVIMAAEFEHEPGCRPMLAACSVDECTHDYAILVLRADAGYRGGVAYTGDAKSVVRVTENFETREKWSFWPWPREVEILCSGLQRGSSENGSATSEQHIVLMPRDVWIRAKKWAAPWSRLVKTSPPSRYFAFIDGNMLCMNWGARLSCGLGPDYSVETR